MKAVAVATVAVATLLALTATSPVDAAQLVHRLTRQRHHRQNALEQQARGGLRRLTPGTDAYTYPVPGDDEKKAWIDSTGVSYKNFVWGGAANGIGVSKDAATWDKVVVDGDASPVFYHSTALTTDLEWKPQEQPKFPLWITSDLEQSVALAARKAANDAADNFFVYPMQVVKGQKLTLFPLPPCKAGGALLLNAYLDAKSKEEKYKGMPKVRFPKPLMGEPAGNAEKAAIGLVCQLWAGEGYDGWRSAWDQDEVMVCPMSLWKLSLPGMAMPKFDASKAPTKELGAFLAHDAVAHKLTGRYVCGPKGQAALEKADKSTAPKDKLAALYTFANGHKDITLKGQLETVANTYSSKADAKNPIAGGPHAVPPGLNAAAICKDGEQFRFAYYYRLKANAATAFDEKALNTYCAKDA